MFALGALERVAAARLRTSERRATFRFKADSAAALSAAGFCTAGAFLESTGFRAPAALAALRLEILEVAVFFGARVSLLGAVLPVAVRLTDTAGFASAARLATVGREAALFLVRAVPLLSAAARAAAAVFFPALAGVVAREVAAAALVLAFTFCTGFEAAGFFTADFLVENFFAASFLAAACAADFLALESASANRLDALALRLLAPGFVSDDFMVFLTDAIASALLFLSRFGDGTAHRRRTKHSAVWKLCNSALERLEAGCS
ncbi:MAG TPA: hypothetical protein VLZ74_01090 [Methylocella sp.]|nr:hypothetical protein [Methylocella sp.]